jgi:hypothetical protein
MGVARQGSRWCVGALIVAATTMLPRVGLAQTPTDPAIKPKSAAEADALAHARELFVEGSAKAEAGDWEGARDRFSRSLKLKHAPLTLYNLGIAQEETGHLVEALANLRAFLASPADASTQRYLDPVRADLVKLEARIPQIQVTVRRAAIAKLALKIDAQSVPLGLSHQVDPGVHEVVVSGAGFGEATQRTTLGEGARAILTIDLEARPAPKPLGAVLPVTLTAGGAALLIAGGVVLGAGLASRATPAGDRQIAAGAGVGALGAIGLGAGIGLFAVRSRRASDTAVVPWLGPGSGGVRGTF